MEFLIYLEKKDLTKNKGTNNNLLAIDATETPIERIKKGNYPHMY
ncbi:hypothetical protein [Spiroplasma endosymbiont of Zeiraphera isertana]